MSKTENTRDEMPETGISSITFHVSQYKKIRLLPPKKQLAIYQAICEYEVYGTVADFGDDVMMDALFGMMIPGLDAIVQRKKNGARGGRPKGGGSGRRSGRGRSKVQPEGDPQAETSAATADTSASADDLEDPPFAQSDTGRPTAAAVHTIGAAASEPVHTDAASTEPAQTQERRPDAGSADTELSPTADSAAVPGLSNTQLSMLEMRAREDRFDRFWSAYPRKHSRLDAEREWIELAPDDALTNLMIEKIAEQQQKDYRFRSTRFTPLPSTWLRRGEWENDYSNQEPEEPASAQMGRTSGHAYSNDTAYIPEKPPTLSDEEYAAALATMGVSVPAPARLL